MTVWVALLRAVNVSGVNKLPMAEFRALMSEMGLEQPKTYIQSGNAVFGSSLTAPVLSHRLADNILVRFGFRPPVVILSAAQIKTALEANPFAQATSEPTHLHAFFMDRALPDAGFAFLKSMAVEREAYAVRGKVLWLYLPDGIARSKLAKRVMGLPLDITARNLRSVQALAQIAGSFAS